MVLVITFVVQSSVYGDGRHILTSFAKNIVIDQYLPFNYIMTATGTVLIVMSTIYVWIFASKAKLLAFFLEFNIPIEIVQFISFILNCFFLEKLSKETQKLLNHLDNLNININDDTLFKALILFRTSIDKAKYGFTIGGFAPWNDLTLLQVK